MLINLGSVASNVSNVLFLKEFVCTIIDVSISSNKSIILLSSKNFDISIDIFFVVEELDSFFSNKVSNTSIYRVFKVTILGNSH